MCSKQVNVGDKNLDDIPQQYRKYDKLLLKLKNDLKKGFSKLTTTNLTISIGDTQDVVDHDIESFNSKFAIALMSLVSPKTFIIEFTVPDLKLHVSVKIMLS
jgi:hypothetical protein